MARGRPKAAASATQARNSRSQTVIHPNGATQTIFRVQIDRESTMWLKKNSNHITPLSSSSQYSVRPYKYSTIS